jgi:hypothetical protein
VGALIAIGMVLLFMAKNRVKTKWFSTNGKADLSSAIPQSGGGTPSWQSMSMTAKK